MGDNVTRREFLGTSGKAAGVAALGLGLAGCEMTDQGGTAAVPARRIGPNDKITVALVGCGGMGRYKFNNFMDSKECNVAALCDVDERQFGPLVEDVEKKLGTKPKTVKEYQRVMEMKDVDVVIVATPDHWHAAPMMAAAAAGKDVYCEKPCCHNIHEGRAMAAAA